MHLRRLACFLLGGWLVGSTLMLLVTGLNSSAADSVSRSLPPDAIKLLAPLSGEQQRMILFHMANEASRSYGSMWEIMQIAIGLGAGAALFLEPRTRFYSAGIGLMLLLAIFESLVIVPQLEWLGHSVDFVPWTATSTTRTQYWNLRAVFVGIETVKLIVGAGLAIALFVVRSRSSSSRSQNGDALSAEERPRRRRGSRSGEHAARP